MQQGLSQFAAMAVALAWLGPVRVRAEPPPPPAPTPVPVRYDTLGVRTGQTPDQVRAALAAAEPGGETRDARRTDPDGRSYVSQIQFRLVKENPHSPRPFVDERIRVIFSSPATGNRALSVQRHTEYTGDVRPLLSTLDAAFAAKYGVSPEMRASPPAGKKEQDFLFGPDGRLLESDPAYDRSGDGPCSLTNSDMANMGVFSGTCRSAVFDWNIMVDVDPERVASLTVAMKDIDFARAAIEVDSLAAARARAAELEHLKTAAPPKL